MAWDCVVELSYGGNGLEPRENSLRKRTQRKGSQITREQCESLGMLWGSHRTYMDRWVPSSIFAPFPILLATSPFKIHATPDALQQIT